MPPGVPERFASSGRTKAASTLRSAARTPKHRRSSDSIRRLEESEQGFFAISSPLTDCITKHGRLGKLHVVPALAGPDRLQAGLHTKSSRLPAKQKRHLCCSEFLRTEQGGVFRAATDRCRVQRRNEPKPSARPRSQGDTTGTVRWTRTGGAARQPPTPRRDSIRSVPLSRRCWKVKRRSRSPGRVPVTVLAC